MPTMTPHERLTVAAVGIAWLLANETYEATDTALVSARPVIDEEAALGRALSSLGDRFNLDTDDIVRAAEPLRDQFAQFAAAFLVEPQR